MKNKKYIILGIFIILIVIILICIIPKNNKKEINNVEEKKVEEIPKVNVIDLKSKSRNIAVMYNNISDVWDYQAGLQDAYIVYEIIVEGGYTRLMAIFKDVNSGCISLNS